MLKKLFSRNKKKPLDYFDEVKAAQKQEKPVISYPGSAFRPDRVPYSSVQPGKESVISHRTLRSAIGLLLALVILSILLYSGVGPGRPMLEQVLASLANQVLTPTPTSSPTSIQSSNTPIQPTETMRISPTNAPTVTPDPTPTFRPTNTPLILATASPTVVPFTAPPTTVECREATSITMSDVGQSLCVMGTVLKTIQNPTDFMVLFSFEKGAFYWVTYDLVWNQVDLNTCYQLRGKILRLGNNPIMVFDYQNLPEVCP